jgi:hypothetical protein
MQEVVAEGKAQVQSGIDIRRGLEEDLYAAQSLQVSLLMDTESQHAMQMQVSARKRDRATAQRKRPLFLAVNRYL